MPGAVFQIDPQFGWGWWRPPGSSAAEEPGVFPVHMVVAGRARFRVRGLKNAPAFGRELERFLTGKAGIRSASASAVTGKVLVLFSEVLSPSSVQTWIGEFVRLRPPEPRLRFVPASATAARTGRVSRRRLRREVVRASHPPERDWHRLAAEEALGAFGTHPWEGLSLAAAQRQLAAFGPNVLPESVPRSGWSILLGQLRSLPVLMLAGSAAISLLTGGIGDAVVILAVIGINAAIGYVTESRAEMTIHSLKRLVHPAAHVIREGIPRTIRAEEVVPGDLIVLRPGTYVVADSRIVEAQHLTIDESALTGESLPVVKRPDLLAGAEVPLADRFNMAHTGTLVTGGQGLAVTVATAAATELGRIQSLVEEAESPQTPMERELERLGNRLVWASLGICGVVFGVGLLRGQGFLQMLKGAVTLGVAAIPEGLPTVATTTLALGIGRMKRRGVLIRRLDAVETLGCVQTLCLDKTGTLTQNRMTVTAIHAGGERLEVAGSRYRAGGQEVRPRQRPALQHLLRVVVLCSETEVREEGGTLILHGSATENALIELAMAAGIDVARLRSRHPLLHTAHRSERRNYMSTLHRTAPDEHWPDLPGSGWEGEAPRLVAMKGSPSEVLALCGFCLRGGEVLELQEEDRQALGLENERMAAEALRVLGVACGLVGGEQEGLVWLGLVGMADPLRQGVGELISRFHRAGIETVMITGDQVPTAFAIGRELRLSAGEPLEIFESSVLGEMDPELLAAHARRVRVFARVSPAQKLQIVRAYQRGGRVVAMTGDGINDGPALKAADIGVAMGCTGTDVAREVADIVLEGDDLATMMAAVGEGRTIYANIQKSIRFLLATNMSEIMVMFVTVAAGGGQLLTPIQLLWINLLSDIFPGLALSLEAPEADILERAPRDPCAPIVGNPDLKRTAFEAGVITAGALGAYGYGVARYGMGARAGSVGFLSLVSAQLLHTLSCRSEKPVLFAERRLPPNRYVSLALGGSFLLQLVALAVPGLRGFLGLSPLTLLDGAVVGGSALIPLLVNEASKATGKGSSR